MSDQLDPPLAAAPPEGWLTLHPASLLVNLIPQAWRTARGAWPLLLALFIGGEGVGMNAVDLVVLLVFFGMTLARTVVHWATLRYRMNGGRLEIKSGLLNRRGRVIDPARIQNIEVVRNVFHKLTGLVELRVETAGDASTEGLLSALSVADAQRLRERLQASLGSLPPPDAAPSETVVTVSMAEIVAYGFTRRTVGVVAVLTAVGLELMGRLGPENPEQMAWAMRPAVLVAAVRLALAGSWVFSAGTAFFRHHGFRLLKEHDRLVTEEGLATRRRVEIPLGKIQLLRVDQPLLRRLMGYGTLLIETAGLGIADGQVRQAEGVVPMIDAQELPGVLRVAMPGADVDPFAATLLPAHARALYRGIIGRAVRATVLALVLVALMGPWGWAALLMVPLAVPVAWLDWRWQGWLVTPRALIARRGFFTRHTWLVSRGKLQSVHVVQSPLMRWAGLGRVVVRVAGSDVALPDIGTAAALALLAELSPGASPEPAR